VTAGGNGALVEGLAGLRDALKGLVLGLELPEVERVRRTRTELEAQIDDYLLPRLRQMDAPLLMVVGGSTGAGKSTLVNSLVGASVSRAGVLRPTTRAPVLVCNPGDLRWFEGDRILPGLRRASGGAAHAGELELAPTDRIAQGLALLDAPDIDSVVAENRALASQLLAAADAWLFVTTAARYADAVPWGLLAAARERGTALSVVLNRVPADAVEEVSGHLREMLAERGLGDAELLVVRETTLEDGLIPGIELAPVRRRLDELSADAAARAALVRQTLAGALDSLPHRIEVVRAGAAEQQAAAAELRAAVERAYERALEDVDEAVRSGSLLRGEVLARWHDVVGTGDLMRALETRVGWLRDQLRAIVTGKPAADVELKAAVESSVDPVVVAAADEAAERAAAAWRRLPGGRALLDQSPGLDAASPELLERTKAEVRSWQGYVFELVRSEGESKRTTARLASLGVNGAGLTVMIAVFISTGGLTGTEIVVAGGTSVLSQKVLEAIFGDQAVRELAARARTDLLGRVRRLLEVEAARFLQPLEAAAPGQEETSRLPGALRAIEAAR
jgi:energy-coupling factor transporter ATP-binding protein EcfA2